MCNKSDVIPMAFLESLGDYVYCYRGKNGAHLPLQANGKEKYVGKGRGNRCLVHLNTKNYDIEDLWILASNLERFNLDKKDASFVLESFLISTLQPKDNIVSGHYKECFKMAKFSELFNVYKASQHDNFEALPEWYISNYSKLKGRINILTVKSDTIYVEFSTMEQMQPSFYVTADGTAKQFKFSIWADGDKLDGRLNQLLTFLKSCGIMEHEVEKTGARNTYEIKREMSIDAIINIADQFYS